MKQQNSHADAPLVVERLFDAPVELVWQAITEPARMKQWYFDVPDFSAQPGCEFRFLAGPDDKKYEHVCTVIEVIPERKLSYTWRYAGRSGDSLVTFELFPEASGTRLRLAHSGIETFPADDPAFRRENFAAGWTHIIGTSLDEYLQTARTQGARERR